MENNKIISETVEAIQDKKGTDIHILDLADIQAAPSPLFIICQGRNPSQTNAIAENVIDRLRENLHLRATVTEGMRNGQWIIIDYGQVMVHVFMPEYREFYNIEDLWNDGKLTVVPNLD